MTHARLVKKAASLDVELPIGSGVTALMGPERAGKTLALDLIAGFVRPDSGRVLIEDTIVYDGEARIHLPPRRRRCAYIAAKDMLFPHRNVRQNLLFAAARWSRLERHKRVAEMMTHFGLTDSGGPRLHALAARALLSEPKLLLIDDPAVDEALLRLITAAYSGPILLVTGNLDLCYSCEAELILMESGRIVQRGPARKLIDAPESVQSARLLGYKNIFEATVAALDPGRNTSRLECEPFTLTGPYLPGRFKGDRVTIAIRATDLRVSSGGVPLNLESAREHVRSVDLVFAHGVTATVSKEEWERERDNKSWQVEFPPAALRVF